LGTSSCPATTPCDRARAARSLPQRQQKLAILWGAAGPWCCDHPHRVAVELLKLSFLKLSARPLFWIAGEAAGPRDEGGDDVKSSDT